MSDATCPDNATEADFKIINGDAARELAKLPTGSFSLIVTSPPYNVGKAYESALTMADYLKWYTPVIGRLCELLTNEGSICWQVGNCVRDGEVFPLDVFFYPMFKDQGLKLRNRLVWHYGHGLHASNRFSGRYETMLWFTKSDSYVFNLDSVRIPSKYPGKRSHKGARKGEPSGNPLGKNPSDFWFTMSEEWETGVLEIPNVNSSHREKTKHPCQFPVELVERCVLAFTNPGDLILDPFVGSGTSIVAALKQNRRAIGIDSCDEYCRLALERVIGLRDGSLKLREIGTPLLQPDLSQRVARMPEEWLQMQSS